MTLHEAIGAAECVLPGEPGPDGEIDPRWQAIIAIGEFIGSEPEAVWSFVLKWGGSEDEDLRTAVATCLLEHLLEHDFDTFITRVEQRARLDGLFGAMVGMCWIFRAGEEPERQARFDRLIESIRQTD